MPRYPLEGADLNELSTTQLALYFGFAVVMLQDFMRDHEKDDTGLKCKKDWNAWPCDTHVKWTQFCDMTAHATIRKQVALKHAMEDLD